MDPITLAMNLAQLAPSVIKWISGSDKAAEAAQHIVTVAEAVTGRTGADAVDALRADPVAMLEFREKLAAMEADLDKAYLADRADARARDVALAQAGKRNVRADVMVLGVLVSLVCSMGVLMYFGQDLPDMVAGILSTVIGIFGKCLSDAFQYEFGSSRGSADKTAALVSVKG